MVIWTICTGLMVDARANIAVLLEGDDMQQTELGFFKIKIEKKMISIY